MVSLVTGMKLQCLRLVTAGVLRVVDIDPQWSIGSSKELITRQGVEMAIGEKYFSIQ